MTDQEFKDPPSKSISYTIYSGDEVNCILAAAMRVLTMEQLCVLRDALIERTVKSKQDE